MSALQWSWDGMHLHYQMVYEALESRFLESVSACTDLYFLFMSYRTKVPSMLPIIHQILLNSSLNGKRFFLC
jgi:hypothetical protein